VILSCGLLRNENDPLALNRARIALINRVTRLIESPREMAVIVFDAKLPPAGLPSIFHTRGATVMFAKEYDEADDLIEHLIRIHSSPKQLTVVSSDRRLQTAAKRRRAVSKTAEVWLDEMIAAEAKFKRQKSVGQQPPTDSQPPLDERPVEVDKWLEFFQIDDRELLIELGADAESTTAGVEDFQSGVSAEFGDLFGSSIKPADLDDMKGVFPQEFLDDIEAELGDDEDLI